MKSKQGYRILINKNLVIFSGAMLSAFIYFFYRGNGIIFNQILSTFQFERILFKDMISAELPLHDWVVYSLPGGIWVFVLSTILKNYHFRIFDQRLPLDYLPIVYGIGLEILQFFHWTDGTFDWLDILFILFGAFCCNLLKQNSNSVLFTWKYLYRNLLIIPGFLVLILSDVSN